MFLKPDGRQINDVLEKCSVRENYFDFGKYFKNVLSIFTIYRIYTITYHIVMWLVNFAYRCARSCVSVDEPIA